MLFKMFRKRFLFTLLLFVVLLPASGLTKSSYQSSLRNLVPQEARGNGKLGVYVKSLNTGKVLFEYNPNKNFIPASNNKVISSYSFSIFNYFTNYDVTTVLCIVTS